MAHRNWNPSEPTVLGLEWPGMRSIAMPLSQDVEYGYTFESNAAEIVDTATFLLVEPEVSFYTVATGLVTVYERGDELAYGIPTSQVVPVNNLSVVGTATDYGWGASALTSPADEKFVDIPNDAIAEVSLEFATNGVFVNKRILELRVRYVAEATNDVEGVVPALKLLLSSGAVLGLNGYTAIDPHNSTALPVRTVSLGECNYCVPLLTSDVWPWTEPEVADFDTGVFNLRFQSVGDGTDVRLHYVALEVVYCEENRVAVGATALRQGLDPPVLGKHNVHLRTPAGSDNWAKAADIWYTITLTSARSPGPFINAIEDIAALSMKQTQGPSPHVPLIDSFAGFVGHAGRVAPRTPTNVLSSAEDDTRLCPILLITTAPLLTTDHDIYDAVFGAPLYSGGGNPGQDIDQHSGGGLVEYPWITFYIRRIGNPPGPVNISANGGLATTTITDAQIQEFPEIFDGWRKVVWNWDPNVPSYDNSSTDDPVEFSTPTGDLVNRYELLGLNTLRLGGGLGPSGTYGEGGASSYMVAGVPRIYSDLVVMMHTEAETVAGFDVQVLTSEIPGRTLGSPGPCQVSEFDAPELTWTVTSISTDDFLHYEIQRKDTISTTYQTIAKLTNRAAVSFLDMEARLTVASTYRMRVCRRDGICSDWTAEETVTPTAGDISEAHGCGFLMFCSNEDLVDNMVIYSDIYGTDPTGQFHFVEADDYTLTRHYGRFGTQSFHPTERGGVVFERSLLVRSGAGCDDTDGGLADHEFDKLRDLAYRDLPYVCVKDDQGNRWFATVIVPDGTVRRPKSIVIASVRVIESTDAPWPVADQI